MKRIYFFASHLLAACALSLPVSAQSPLASSDGLLAPALQGGIGPSSRSLSDIEHLNLYNGNLNVTIPLLRVGGRGSAGYDIVLPIERHWSVQYDPNQNKHTVYSWADPWLSELDLLTFTAYSPGQLTIRHASSQPANCGDSSQGLGPYNTRVIWLSPDGSETVLRDTQYDGQAQGVTVTSCSELKNYNPASRGPKFVSDDGSDLIFISDSPISDSATTFPTGDTYQSGKLYFKDGTVYTIDSKGRASAIEDRNGNVISLTYGTRGDGYGDVVATDSFGRKISVNIGDNVCTNGPMITPEGWDSCTDTITYPGPNNQNRTIVINHPILDNVLAPGQSKKTYAALFPSLQGDQTFFGRQSAP